MNSNRFFGKMARFLTDRGWKVWSSGERMGGPVTGLTHDTKSPDKHLTYGQAFDLEMAEECPELYRDLCKLMAE